jgi:TolB-like protein/DNA-binding winged helix-turn-helix (wHTH) protein
VIPGNTLDEPLNPSVHRLRLGDFEMDFVSGELRRNGHKTRLKPQPCRVLELLVRRSGETVLREDIQREVWGSETFVDFERGLNSCIKQIRAAFGDQPDAPLYIETIPRRGYRFMAKVELVEEIHTSSPIARAPEIPQLVNAHVPGHPTSSRKLWRISAILSALIVLSVGLATMGFHRSRQTNQQRIKLAVLPFANLSGDPKQDFFGDGLSEELITHLGELAPRKLGVIASTSAAQYRQTGKSAAQIGSELGVTYLLQGSVRREGNQLHVTAQLIQTADQTQLWAASYDRDSADLLSVETDLSQRVARSLALKLLPPRENAQFEPASRNPAAHEAYLRGRYDLNTMSLEGFRGARTHFEVAIRLDPGFALAYAGLADTYSLEPWWGGMAPREAFPKARAAVQQALRLDDNLAEAHTSLGFIHLYYDWDLAAAAGDFERAIQLEPGLALAHYWYAGVLSAAGRHDDAIASIQRAQELDPLSPLVNADAGWYYIYARRFAEAIPQCRRALEMNPKSAYAVECIMESHRALGKLDEALTDSQQLVRMRSVRFTGAASGSLVAYSTPLEGLRQQTQWTLSGVTQLSRQHLYISPYELAILHVRLNQKEEALAELEQARARQDTMLVLIDVDPRMDPLRNDPRFIRFRRSVSLTPLRQS